MADFGESTWTAHLCRSGCSNGRHRRQCAHRRQCTTGRRPIGQAKSQIQTSSRTASLRPAARRSKACTFAALLRCFSSVDSLASRKLHRACGRCAHHKSAVLQACQLTANPLRHAITRLIVEHSILFCSNIIEKQIIEIQVVSPKRGLNLSYRALVKCIRIATMSPI